MPTPTALPASFTAGDVLTAANMNLLRGAFRVLQVVNASYSISTANSTSTFADTGLSATITPSSTSSKVLIVVHQAGCGKEGSNTWCQLRLLRGATNIIDFEKFAGGNNAVTNNLVGGTGTTFLDSPSTTSATTYKTQFMSGNNTSLAIVQVNDGVSSITLMEISA